MIFVKAVEKVFSFFSGEWLLSWFGNGGLTIFIRSAIVSALLVGAALAFESWSKAGVDSVWSTAKAIKLVGARIEWFGAAFAAAYVAFYSRYSGQWTYLADLYNQIMSVKCGVPEKEQSRNKSLVRWQVGFIADAHTLHLDSKDLFKGVICAMLEDEAVYEEFSRTLGTDEEKGEKKREETTAAKIIRRVGFDPSIHPASTS